MATLDPTKDLSEQIQFKQLLEEAVTKPGTLMRAYSLFWNYSLGNQILALPQSAVSLSAQSHRSTDGKN